MPHDVDQHLTVLPEVSDMGKAAEAASPGAHPQLFIVTITRFRKQLADVWSYLMVLAAAAAAGTLWFWN